MSDEVYFWHGDKHRSLLQVDTIILGLYKPGMPKVPKIGILNIFAISPEKHWGWGWGGGGVKLIFCKFYNKFAISLQYLKELIDEVDFGMQINIEVFYKLILSFWVCTTRHAQSNKSKKFAYLCNISRKVWWVKLIFCLQINTKVCYKLIVSLWVCVARHD